MLTSVMSCDEASPFHHVARLETHLIAASCITLAATDAVTLAGAHRVHVEPEHLADVDEREGPVRAIAPHPGLGLRGQPTRAEAALPASLFDALYRVLQDGEHECTRS